MLENEEIIEGCLLGMAVGDSIGLPMEGMSRAKIEKLGWANRVRQRLLFGRGCVSDDTEHAMMVLEAVIASKGDCSRFLNSLRWRMRWWFIGLPAGVGMATAKSCLKLWLGCAKSGVFSAGNGPAMRSVVLGARFCNDEERRRKYVTVSTEMSHTDPKALIGAHVISELAALLAREECIPTGDKVHQLVRAEGFPDEALTQWQDHCAKGVSGYMYHTVPAVIATGIKFDWCYEQCIIHIIKMGGDTDTTAAILGGLCGILSKKHVEEREHSIPQQWLDSIVDFPRSVKSMKLLAQSGGMSEVRGVRRFKWWFPVAVILRNIVFLIVILSHGLMRPFMGLLPHCNEKA